MTKDPTSARLARIAEHPTHAAEIALGAVLIGAGSASLIPNYVQGASYQALFALGGQPVWAVLRIVTGALLVAAALHDIVTHFRLRWMRRARIATTHLGFIMFCALMTGFLATGSYVAVGAYGAATLIMAWAIGTTSAHKRA